MADELPKIPAPSAPRIMAKIVVAMTDAGELLVSGSLEDVVLAYGMLELAKDAVRDHQARASRSVLLLPASARVGRKPAPPAQDKPAEASGG